MKGVIIKILDAVMLEGILNLVKEEKNHLYHLQDFIRRIIIL